MAKYSKTSRRGRGRGRTQRRGRGQRGGGFQFQNPSQFSRIDNAE